MSSNKIFTFLMYHHSGKAEIQKFIARHLFKCFKIKKEKEEISLQNGGVPVSIRLRKKILSLLVFYCNVCLYSVRYGSSCRVMYAHVCSELLYTSVYGGEKLRTALTPVVPKVNSAIQRITLYPMDNAIGFHNIIRWIVSYQAPVVQKGAG